MRAVAALALALGCTSQYDPCFTQDTDVHALQFLAVRADPPEAVLAADGSPPPVVVTALVAHPLAMADTRVSLGASTCAPTDDRRCQEAPQLVSEAAPGEQSFTVQVTPALLSSALAADPLAGYGGIRVQLNLEAVDSGGARTVAEKLLLYSRPGGPPPNRGFRIAALRVRRFGFTFHEDANVPLPPADQTLLVGETLEVDVGDPVWLQPILAPAAGATEVLEEYDVVDLSGRAVHLREQVSYTFYTNGHADFDPATASEPDPAAPQPSQGLTRYRFLKTRGGSATIWIVARDSRGAQAWAEVPVAAADRRGCAVARAPCPLIEYGCL